MSTTLELCQKYFKSQNIYEIFGIQKHSLEKDIKKAYYKLSLKVHPDRVDESEKAEATEKFKLLSKLHLILTDKNKKQLYDEKGIIDDEDDIGFTTLLEQWRQFFKPITTKDIDDYRSTYVGSDIEKYDVKKAYLNGKGCKNHMMNCVPFLTIEDEPRIAEIVNVWIASGEVPAYSQFTNEPKAKQTRRHNKYAKEAKEAEKLLKEKQNQNLSLEQQIMQRHSSRNSSFLNYLADKYKDNDMEEDDSVEFSLPPKKRGKTSRNRATPKRQNVIDKDDKEDESNDDCDDDDDDNNRRKSARSSKTVNGGAKSKSGAVRQGGKRSSKK